MVSNPKFEENDISDESEFLIVEICEQDTNNKINMWKMLKRSNVIKTDVL